MKEYYDRRSAEYDETSYGAADDNEARELERLMVAIASLPSALTLDVACGTGYLTRHLQGQIVGLDHSEGMLRVASGRLRGTPLVRGDATALPFRDSSFDRVFTSFFYGHLEEPERRRFVEEASPWPENSSSWSRLSETVSPPRAGTSALSPTEANTSSTRDTSDPRS